MKFQIEFTTRALKDLKSFPVETQKKLLEKTLQLESAPFPHKKTIKKIKGVKFPCFRLRIEFKQNTFRLFYGIDKNIIFVLRIVSKKDSDKILKNIKTIDFPPEL